MKWLLLIFLFFHPTFANAQGISNFNLEHIRGAIRYFEEGNKGLINNLALTEAARYIQNHAIYSGHIFKDIPILNQTQTLVSNKSNTSNLDNVKARVSEIENNKFQQNKCYQKVQKYFPEGPAISTPLYLTWGYELESAHPEGASINIADRFFDNFPEEIWIKCSIYVTKSTLLKKFPSPLPDSKDTLLATIQNQIFIEGVGEFMGFSSSSNNKMETYEGFLKALENSQSITSFKKTYLNHEDWDDVGQHMAYSISSKLGENALIEAITEGSQAFFAAYNSIKDK